LCPVLLFLFVVFIRFPRVISAAATTTKAKTFDEADDRHSQEEAHQTSQLGNELDSVFREVVDVLVLERPEEQLENDRVGVRTLDGLARSDDLSLNGGPLQVGVRRERWVQRVPDKT